MADSELYKVNVSINKQLHLCFDAQKVVGENGVGFIEKNNEKNIDDLACVALYSKEKDIALRIGISMCMFKVLSGNLNEFFGDYEISFLGLSGIVRITKAE